MPALLTSPAPTLRSDEALEPARLNGARGHGPPADEPPDDPGRAYLARLFAGTFPFTAVTPARLPPGDRTAAEYDAAARAAGCRDLFVVHADPFAGEKLIADLARAAALDRVLVLSPNPTAADRLTERLVRCGVAVLRALAPAENPVRPSPAVSKVTSAALGAGRAEQAKREAAAAVAAAEKRLDAFAPVAKAVARLREVTAQLRALEAAAADHAARGAAVEAEVADEVAARRVTAFTELVARRRTEHEATLAGLVAAREDVRAAANEKEAEVKALRQQHAVAAQKSGFFGRLFSKPAPAAEADDVKKQLLAAESELAALTAAVEARQADFDGRAAALAAEREKLIADETAARRRTIAAALAAAESDRDRARAEAAALGKAIAAAVPNDDLPAAEDHLAAARARAAEVARAAHDALGRALAEPRVVVGTPGCLGSDPVFAALSDAAPGRSDCDPLFGLLVLDRAEELPEPQFPALARLAGRWVLVGDVLPPDPRAAHGHGPPRHGRNGRPPELPFAARVARLLDRETWATEGERLVCRLVHLTPEQRRTAAREPLADRPEIELRFAAADGEPQIAEIAFPGTTAVAEAKRFLFVTLGEVLLRPCGEAVWATAADASTVSWPAADADRDAVWIDLEPGVREKVAGGGLFAYTAAVRFDAAAGWDAERAAAWLAGRLPPAVGRFVALPRGARG